MQMRRGEEKKRNSTSSTFVLRNLQQTGAVTLEMDESVIEPLRYEDIVQNNFSSTLSTNYLSSVQQTESVTLEDLEIATWNLQYDTRVQQVNVSDRITLSTGNLLQYFLLRTAFPSRSFTSPFNETDLHRISQNRQMIDIANSILREIGDSQSPRESLRNFYGSMEALAPAPPPPRRDRGNDRGGNTLPLQSAHVNSDNMGDNGDDLPKKIASEIANIYYANLELTLDNVEEVIKKHIPQKANQLKISDELIERIVHARVDNDRYELLMLLPDKNLIKAAVESLKGNTYRADSITARFKEWWHKLWSRNNTPPPPPDDPLANEKQVISRILDKYITWWKGSWFGHHHNDRARAVKAAVNNSNNVDEIRHILQRQKIMMRQHVKENVTTPLPESNWINERWNTPSKVKTLPVEPITSGYYRAVHEAFEESKKPSFGRK